MKLRYVFITPIFVATTWLFGASHAMAQPAAAPGCPALLQQKFNRLQDEAPQNLCQYAGKVALVVNTATDSDASGTGERASATGRDLPDGADILPDHLTGPAGALDDGTEGARVKATLSELAAEPTDPADAPNKNP